MCQKFDDSIGELWPRDLKFVMSCLNDEFWVNENTEERRKRKTFFWICTVVVVERDPSEAEWAQKTMKLPTTDLNVTGYVKRSPLVFITIIDDLQSVLLFNCLYLWFLRKRKNYGQTVKDKAFTFSTLRVGALPFTTWTSVFIVATLDSNFTESALERIVIVNTVIVVRYIMDIFHESNVANWLLTVLVIYMITDTVNYWKGQPNWILYNPLFSRTFNFKISEKWRCQGVYFRDRDALCGNPAYIT